MAFEGKYNFFMKRHKDVPNVKNGEYQSFFGYFTKVDFFKNLKKKPSNKQPNGNHVLTL